MISPRISSVEHAAVCVLATPLGAVGGIRALSAPAKTALARAFFEDTCAALSQVPWVQPAGVWLRAKRAPRSIDDLVTRAVALRGPSLVVLADGPGVPRLFLDRARAALKRSDAVLGPREGGGLYLVGLSSPLPGLLAGLTLSDAGAFEAVRKRLTASGCSFAVLPPWLGVVEATDLHRLRQAIERGEIAAPATARVLARPRISLILALGDDTHRTASSLSFLTQLPDIDEVIVVATATGTRALSIARRFPARIIDGATRGAQQWNLGARAASGDVVWFLSPELTPPRDAACDIANALIDGGCGGGWFRTATIADDWHPRRGPLLHLADLPTRLGRLPRADQGLFVRTSALERAGAFDEQLSERIAVIDLARRLLRDCRLAHIPQVVTVASGPIARHPLRHAALSAISPMAHRARAAAHLLDRR